MNFINYNGQLFPADQALFSAQDRATKYGDGLFETIRMFEGQLPFFALHYQRLKRGVNHLQLPWQNEFTQDFFRKEIQKLLGKQANARIRLNLYRQAAGKYLPKNAQTVFLIEAEPLETASFSWLAKGLHIDLCKSVQLCPGPLSDLKTMNSLPYILAAQYREAHQLDDCLLLNLEGNLAEASSSNLFLFDQETLYTPAPNQGAIAGTMQQVVLELAQALQIPIKIQALPPSRLQTAQEVFLTNAIQGIRWVQSFRQVQYHCERSKRLFVALQQKIRENPKKSL